MHANDTKPITLNLDTREYQGFTIIELLIVIVVIGILATVTIISYGNLTQKATETAIRHDLGNASTILNTYYNTYGSYPITLDGNYCPVTPTQDEEYCLKTSNGNTLTYQPSTSTGSPDDFIVTISKNSIFYRIGGDGKTSSQLSKSCPYGFIVVPGSSTYGTSDFCVMKYEAKADDNGDGIGDTTRNTGSNSWPADTYPISATRKLVSTPNGWPVANMGQATQISAALNYTNGCSSGCHLISEAEWMTLAKNIASVGSNWSSGVVGTGYLYTGQNDDNGVTLQASPDDSNGYYGTKNSATDTTYMNGMIGKSQRRTFTLTNGEVIWDVAGNVWERTSGQTTGGHPGIAGESAASWKEWTAVNVNGSLAVNPFPSNTGLTNSSLWNSTYGAGQLASYINDSTLRGFRRGGAWFDCARSGIYALNLLNNASYFDDVIGMRVAKS